MRVGTTALLVELRISSSFHWLEESCMASATCAAVTKSRGERNQPVPLIATTSAAGRLSPSANSREMLAVVLVRLEGSMHEAATSGDRAAKMPLQSKRR